MDPDDVVDEDAVGVAKMRASEIKAELDMRGIDYKGIFEKVMRRTVLPAYAMTNIPVEQWPP